MTFVFKVLRDTLLRYILYTCPNLWWPLCLKCSAMDCRYILCTCPKLWWRLRTASVHTLHMSKAVMTFLFKVLRNALLRYILYTCPNLWLRSCAKCYGMHGFGTFFTHVQTCDDVRVQSATEYIASLHTLHMSQPVMTFVFKVLCNGLLRYILCTCPKLWWRWRTASVHTLHMSKAVMMFVFKVLRNALLRYILYPCPNLWLRSCAKCYRMHCFGTFFTHVQTCDYVRATQWAASVHTLHMSKPVITFVFKVLRNGLLRYTLYTCPNLWLRSCSKCYAMGCFGTFFTHVQTCDYVRVQSATQWAASVHTLHMSKPVITFVFQVLRNGLLRYTLYTCPNLWLRSCSKCYAMDWFGTHFTHVQTCDYVRVQRAMQWTASVHTLHMSKPGAHFTHVQACDYVRVQSAICNGLLPYTLYTCPNLWLFVFKVLRNGLLRYTLYTFLNLWLRSCSKCYGLLRYTLYTCPNLWLRSCSKCYAMDCFGTYFIHVQICDYVRVQSATECTDSVHTLHMSKPVASLFNIFSYGGTK